jgi:hypothetical protein
MTEQQLLERRPRIGAVIMFGIVIASQHYVERNKSLDQQHPDTVHGQRLPCRFSLNRNIDPGGAES